jgi:molybdenum-dependent DNA-binding transcriptional regulator ModE
LSSGVPAVDAGRAQIAELQRVQRQGTRSAAKRIGISYPCVVKLTLPITKFQVERVSDGNAVEQNLEVADLKTRA